MKKRIISLLFAAAFLLAGCAEPSQKSEIKEKDYIENGYAKNDINRTEFKTVAENSELILRLNYDTTDIEVLVKKTGYVWKSVGGIGGEGQGSAIAFTYLNTSGAVVTMDSMKDSVKKGQYQIKEIDNGVRITYSFGDIVNDLIYPNYIMAERFEEFTGKMSDRDRATVISLYRHLAPDLYSDEVYESFIKDNPAAKGKDVYILRNTDMLLNAKKQLSKAFSSVNYTEEELKKDNEEFDLSTSISSDINFRFNVGLEYVIDGADLTVRLPADQRFHNSNTTGIENLLLLQNFGSPNTTDDGYFVLPDGSGSVMNFYNGKESAGQTMFIPLYGENHSISKNEDIYNLNQAIFPVFGTKIGQNAFISVIEDGDAIASVNAISGTDTLSAKVWASFSILDTQTVYPKSLSDSSYYLKSAYIREQKQPYTGDIKVRYHFLCDGDADYSGMARYYSDYLFGDSESKQREVPMYLELVSAIDYKKVTAGFSNKVISTLTTFKEAGDIAKDLSESGISRQKLILSGWQSTGWRNTYADKFKFSSAAGGEKEFKALSNSLKKQGIEFFPEADVQFVYSDTVKNVKKDLVSRTLVQQLAKKFSYNLSSYQQDTVTAYAMTPDYTESSMQLYIKQMKKLGTQNVALRYFSKYLIPDYTEKNVVDREEVKDKMAAAANKQTSDGVKLLSRTGNAPFASFIGDIVELPVNSTGNNSCAYEIPFAAMVYSGHADYSGRAVNLSGGSQKDLLKLIESNAGLYCFLSARSDDNIKSSDFSDWYSICYYDLKDDVVSAYKTVSTALKDTYGLRIVRHEKLMPNVFCTELEDGTYFIVNYNEYEVEINGATIKASDYLKGRNQG